MFHSFLASITRFTYGYAFALYGILLTETFDQKVGSTAMGLAVGSGNMGKMLVPFLIGSMNNMGIEPIIACSVLYFILSLLPVILI